MFRNLNLFALLLAFCTILLGAIVRMSDAGFACPDWPGCYGEFFPKNTYEFKQRAQLNFPGHALHIAEAWLEMFRRYADGMLALSILMLTLLSWREKNSRKTAIISSVMLLATISLQILVDKWSTALQSMPFLNTVHMMLGMMVFWGLFKQRLLVKPEVYATMRNPALYFLATFIWITLFLNIFLGGWVSVNDAGLVCTDFPTCQYSWWPSVNYLESLDFIRGIVFAENEKLTNNNQIAVHWLHRVGAVTNLLLIALLALSSSLVKPPKGVKSSANILLALIVVQFVLGVSSVILHLPAWSSLLHSAIAPLLMIPLVYYRFRLRFTYLKPYEDALRDKSFDDGSSALDSEQELTLHPIDQVDFHDDVAEDVLDDYLEPSAENILSRLQGQLKKTRTGLGQAFSSITLGARKIDEELLEELEASLIMADVGMEATTAIIQELTENVQKHQLNDAQALTDALKKLLINILQPCNQPLVIPEQDGPFVILVVGVNGVGKTTTIGKMAKRLHAQGHSVMLAAGDTFRAAAVEQLQTWGERNNIPVVAQHTGADSASVLYDGVQSAQAKGIDVLIADTAGRLHTKANLMEELKKVKRIISKLDEQAPHEVLLVLDSGTGQNALSQAKIFNDTVALSGIALTKLDGTAKGGVIFALAKQFGVPIRYIGLGEGIDDLQDFHAEQFVDALFVQD